MNPPSYGSGYYGDSSYNAAFQQLQQQQQQMNNSQILYGSGASSFQNPALFPSASLSNSYYRNSQLTTAENLATPALETSEAPLWNSSVNLRPQIKTEPKEQKQQTSFVPSSALVITPPTLNQQQQHCGGGKAKKRNVFTPEQNQALKAAYSKSERFIPASARRKLASEIGLTDNQVKIWFQNRRYKDKKKENDREFMKREAHKKRLAALNNESGGTKEAIRRHPSPPVDQHQQQQQQPITASNLMQGMGSGDASGAVSEIPIMRFPSKIPQSFNQISSQQWAAAMRPPTLMLSSIAGSFNNTSMTSNSLPSSSSTSEGAVSNSPPSSPLALAGTIGPQQQQTQASSFPVQTAQNCWSTGFQQQPSQQLPPAALQYPASVVGGVGAGIYNPMLHQNLYLSPYFSTYYHHNQSNLRQ